MRFLIYHKLRARKVFTQNYHTNCIAVQSRCTFCTLYQGAEGPQKTQRDHKYIYFSIHMYKTYLTTFPAACGKICGHWKCGNAGLLSSVPLPKKFDYICPTLLMSCFDGHCFEVFVVSLSLLLRQDGGKPVKRCTVYRFIIFV